MGDDGKDISSRSDDLILDRYLASLHTSLFLRYPHACFSAAFVAYVALVVMGPSLGTSVNFFVILPVITAAISYGFWGGLVSGALGLPANLLLFALLKRPDLSPASKALAELSGLIVGGVTGYLSDFFRRMTEEIQRRLLMEDSLRKTMKEKDFLYREIHHRVKNNLNIVKSLIRLQSGGSDDPLFREACGDLEQRIYAIALIHEGLYRHSDVSTVIAGDYLRSLLGNISEAFASERVKLSVDIGPIRRNFSIDTAVPFGLILNEIVTNAYKYAFDSTDFPEITVSLREINDEIILEVSDNGHGFEPSANTRRGLGMRLVSVLSKQLRGTCRFEQRGGTRFLLSFPVKEDSYNS